MTLYVIEAETAQLKQYPLAGVHQHVSCAHLQHPRFSSLLSLYIYLSIYVSILFLSLYLFIYLSIYLSAYISLFFSLFKVSGFCWVNPVLIVATYNAAKTGYNYYSVNPQNGASTLVAQRQFGSNDDYTGYACLACESTPESSVFP